MKKAFKIVCGVVVAFGVLVGVASVALHVLLPPEKAKALVLKQLTAHLKRQVTVGDVSVGVFTGLSLSNLKISEAPDFSKGTFVTSDHFSIHLALLPLIFRKIEVKQLTLDHPVIQIVREANGKTFNFSDLLESTTAQHAAVSRPVANPFSIPEAFAAAPPPAGAKEAGPSFALLISNAEIKNGVVHFLDRSPAKQSADIDALDLKLKNVSMTAPFSVQSSLQLKARNVLATLKLTGEADLGTDSFKIKTCTLATGGSSIELSGKASQLRSAAPSVDLTLSVKEFRPSTLASFIPLPPALKLDGPLLANARIKGDQKKITIAAEADLKKMQIQYGKQFHKPAEVPMSVSLKGDLAGLQDLEIAELKAILGSLSVVSHGKVLAIKSPQPQVNLHIESNSFPLNDLLGMAAVSLPKDVVVKGKTQFAADVSGTQTSSHVALKLEGKALDIASGTIFHKPADMPMRLSLVGEWVRQTLSIQTMSVVVGSIDVNTTGTIQAAAEPVRIQLALKSKSIALEEASRLSPLLTAYKLKGTAALDAKASGTTTAPVVQGTLVLKDAALRYEQSDLTQISTTLTFTQQDVVIPKLTGQLNGSPMGLKMAGHRLTTQPDVHVEATIQELDLSKLLPPLPAPAAPTSSRLFPLDNFQAVGIAWAAAPPSALPPAKLSGHLNIARIKHEFYTAQNLDCTWNLSDVTPDLALVNGTANLKQGPGVLKDVEKLAAMSKGARIFLQPLVILRKLDKDGLLKNVKIPSLQRIPFNAILGDYDLRKGLMDVKRFELTGSELLQSVNTTGSIGLPDPQPLSLRVVMKLAAGSFGGGDLAEFTADEQGRPTVAFTVSGTSAQPKVVPDLKDIGTKALKKYGGELLKGLGLGGGAVQKAPSPANANPADSSSAPPADSNPPQANPADDIQKALKNIFR